MSTPGGNRAHCESCGAPTPPRTWDGLPVVIVGRVRVRTATGEVVWTAERLLEGGE